MYKSNLANTIGLDYIMADKKPDIRAITVFLNRSNI